MSPRAASNLGVAVLLLSTPAARSADPPSGPAVRLVEIASGLTSPVALVEAPDGTGRLFVVDQIGVIRLWKPGEGLLATPFLDIRDRVIPLQPGYDERGLLGLAFHPSYAGNGRFFVFYNAPLRAGGEPGFDDTVTISQFLVSPDPDTADAASESVLLEVDKPQFNHNGGTLEFGPDGYLYLSIGDGGGANDVGPGHVEDWYADNAGGNAQNVEANLLGKILRIDVDGATPYDVPDDNPFVGLPGLDEIWAYGFRNPYRMAFDGDRLFVGDAGQGLWEEVSLAVAGGNFGWNVKEGSHCFDAEDSQNEPPECPDSAPGDVPLLDPILEYANVANPRVEGIGVVVVGGDVYRGDDVPQLAGRYVFGDFSRSVGEPNGVLLVAKERDGEPWKIQRLRVHGAARGELDHYLRGFGQSLDGELYVLGSRELGPTGTTGKVFRLARPGA